MSKYDFIPISEPLDVGTRIHWDESSQCAYFVDVPNCNVYKYQMMTKTMTKAKVGDEPLAFMFPVEGSDTQFIAGLGRKFVFVEWDGQSREVSNVETIAEVDTETDLKDNRLNGAKVDPCGRLWAGTMGPSINGVVVPEKGALYSLTRGVVKKHKCHIGISNGLAWDISDTKNMKMYYCDTLQPKIFQYDYFSDGTINNEKVIFEFEPNKLEGQPDGLTIDTNGDLWLCAIHGSTLAKINPREGTIKEKIEFPTPQITAVTFGGPVLEDLLVTTARIPVNDEIPPRPAGTTYLIKYIGVKGFNGDRYKP